MTVYINGKAVQNSPFDTAPPAELQKRMDKAVYSARARQQALARGDTVEGIPALAYRRLMAQAQAVHGRRWRADEGPRLRGYGGRASALPPVL